MVTLTVIAYPNQKTKGLRFWKNMFGTPRLLLRRPDVGKDWFKGILREMRSESARMIQALLTGEFSIEVQVESLNELTIYLLGGQHWSEMQKHVIGVIEDSFPTEKIIIADQKGKPVV